MKKLLVLFIMIVGCTQPVPTEFFPSSLKKLEYDIKACKDRGLGITIRIGWSDSPYVRCVVPDIKKHYEK